MRVGGATSQLDLQFTAYTQGICRLFVIKKEALTHVWYFKGYFKLYFYLHMCEDFHVVTKFPCSIIQRSCTLVTFFIF